MPWESGGPPATVRLISRAWDRLGHSTLGRRVLALGRVQAWGRRWARTGVVDKLRNLPDDVTVLIGCRNRSDHRIVNALRSVRQQVYPWGSVSALVVDYGSEGPEATRLAEICARFRAEVIGVAGVSVWSRSRCLNIGLRRLRTKYVMTSDADIILSRHYLADAVATLRRHPLSVVCSPMFDLPEESTQEFIRLSREDDPVDMEAWKARSEVRLGRELHSSAGVTFTAFHHAVRGYDEFYAGWGREDDDLMSRLMALGLGPRAIPERSFYLHQWHPKFEGLGAAEQARWLARNTAYIKGTRSLVRNDEGWGRTGTVQGFDGA